MASQSLRYEKLSEKADGEKLISSVIAEMYPKYAFHFGFMIGFAARYGGEELAKVVKKAINAEYEKHRKKT